MSGVIMTPQSCPHTFPAQRGGGGGAVARHRSQRSTTVASNGITGVNLHRVVGGRQFAASRHFPYEISPAAPAPCRAASGGFCDARSRSAHPTSCVGRGRPAHRGRCRRCISDQLRIVQLRLWAAISIRVSRILLRRARRRAAKHDRHATADRAVRRQRLQRVRAHDADGVRWLAFEDFAYHGRTPAFRAPGRTEEVPMTAGDRARAGRRAPRTNPSTSWCRFSG